MKYWVLSSQQEDVSIRAEKARGAIFELSMSISSVISRQLSISFWNSSSDVYHRSINLCQTEYFLTHSLDISNILLHKRLRASSWILFHPTMILKLIFNEDIFWRRFTNSTGWQEGIAAAAAPVVLCILFKISEIGWAV